MSEAKRVHITQGTPIWHSWRKQKHGASDVPPLFGLSPYKTLRDLWFEKQGLGQPDDEDRSYIYQRGHEAEAEIRQMFHDINIPLEPTCFERGEIFGASLDGYHEKHGILEAKLVGKDAYKKAKEKGEYAPHFHLQVQAQLYTSDSDKAYLGMKALGVKGGLVIEIGRDEKLIADIVDRVHKFWESLQSNQVPELTERDTFFLTRAEEIELVQKLIDLKAKKDEVLRQYEEIETKVKGIAHHTRIKYDTVTILQCEAQGPIDYQKIPEIKALQSDYLDGFRKKSRVYKMIRFGGGK